MLYQLSYVRAPRILAAEPEPAQASDGAPGTRLRLVAGMSREAGGVDRCDMIWPVAALAVLVLGFVVVYGSLVQSRLEIGRERNDSRQARRDIAG